MLDATTALVVTLDAEGRVLRCNRACEPVAGRPRAEIEGRYVWESINLPRERVLDVIRDCWRADGAHSLETRLPLHDGTEMIVAWSTAGVRDKDGELAFLVVTGQDITQHRLAQRRLEAAYELEHRVARTLRESLLRPTPDVPGVRFGVAYKPAVEAERVGGDFYDIYRVSPMRLVTLIGDVSGKGVAAAGLTETVRSTLRALLHMGLSPEEALTRANRVLAEQMQPEQFATVGIASLDLESGEVRYASAGHPAPIVVGTGAHFADVVQGVPLGTFDHEYASVTIRLELSDCLLLYTDGLSEARRAGSFFGEQCLLETLMEQPRKPHSIVQGLLEAAACFQSEPLTDDIAIVALQKTAWVPTECPPNAV